MDWPAGERSGRSLLLGEKISRAWPKPSTPEAFASRLFDGRFALTWLFAAYKRRPLNDRR